MTRYALRVGVIEVDDVDGDRMSHIIGDVTEDEPYADLDLVTDPHWEFRGADLFDDPSVAGDGSAGDAVPAYLP